MTREQEIWACDEEREDLWTANASRAAMLAYLDVLALWHDQVTDGVYTGVPAMHQLPVAPRGSGEVEPSTLRSRPARFTKDSSAGQWSVPAEIRRRWLTIA